MKLLSIKKLAHAEVVVDIVRAGNKEIRPGGVMKPTEIAVHNTGNAGKGADAVAHNKYLHNMSKLPETATGYASWHFTVDDKYIYQHIPMDEPAWHTGDGSGPKSGNKNAVGIEICEHPGIDMKKAEENAIALIVYILQTLKIPTNLVKPHKDYSGKHCPRVILNRDGSFKPFHSRVVKAYADANKPVVKAAVKPVAKPVAPVGSYKVAAGDSLWKVSEKFDMTVDELKKLNGLKTDTIYVGQFLKVDKGYKVGTVTADVWLHSKPDYTAKTRVRVLKANEKYRIYGESNGMYNVGANAFVSKKYLKV